MKFLKPDIFGLVLAIMLCFPLSQADEGEVGAFDGEIVRLHVIANSDSENDQALKLKVRDGLLEYVDENLLSANSIDDVNAMIDEKKEELYNEAIRVLRENGCDDDVKILTGIFDFPARSYKNAYFPKGRYNALKVVIGKGKGKNWWCVLYPPLCFAEKEELALSEKAKNILSSNTEEIITKPKYRIKLVEIFKGE